MNRIINFGPDFQLRPGDEVVSKLTGQAAEVAMVDRGNERAAIIIGWDDHGGPVKYARTRWVTFSEIESVNPRPEFPCRSLGEKHPPRAPQKP